MVNKEQPETVGLQGLDQFVSTLLHHFPQG